MLMRTVVKFLIVFLIFFCNNDFSFAQLDEKPRILTRADTLRGTDGPFRQGWDVLHYEITVEPDYASKTIVGKNTMKFYNKGAALMQIDLQLPMILDSVTDGEKSYKFRREENVYWLTYRDPNNRYKTAPGIRSLTFYFHGKPAEAVRPPWDGGWIWKKDKNGNPWMSVACQGLGASVWYPCKDIQSDKPDSGATLHIIAADSLVALGNGRLIKKQPQASGKTMHTWEVKNPINNYNIVPYIGKYVNFSEKYPGIKGELDMSYWVLDYNLEKAKVHFTDAPKMMKAFEHWFGPYPFYEDGFKLVEAPHLGMEHQSAIAYGNGYKKGYAGTDLSGTGEGLKWDFIIIHESGHEWFANSICTKDIADMWVHEGFTNYSETLFTEYYWGKPAGETYVQGIRKNIENDIPIIGPYGVNKHGSGDMYPKAANMLHTIRHVKNNDKKFREMLLGLNKTFHNQTVTTQQVEKYMSKNLKLDLSGVFDQYLRTVNIPILEYKISDKTIEYRWANTVNSLKLPVQVSLREGEAERRITPSATWKKLKTGSGYDGKTFTVNKNFYIETKKVI